MNIIVGIMDQCDSEIDLKKDMLVSDLYFTASDFASYLEDYLMEKCCTWDNWSV